MISPVQNKYFEISTVAHQKRSTQVGNYCFLIAGVEMLLSCKEFINFIVNYRGPDTIDLRPICRLLLQYMKKDKEWELYPLIEKIIFDSLDIKDFGEMEDMNVIFLYFQKSAKYCKIIAPFMYLPNIGHQCPTAERPQPNAIYFIRKYSTVPLLQACNKAGVFSFAIRAGNHYEIYQRYKSHDGKTFFVPKNTNHLLNARWDILCVLCMDICEVLEALH